MLKETNAALPRGVKKKKVVARELCSVRRLHQRYCGGQLFITFGLPRLNAQIKSKGTNTYAAIDVSEKAPMPEATAYLLSIREEELPSTGDATAPAVRFGICLVEASTAEVIVRVATQPAPSPCMLLCLSPLSHMTRVLWCVRWRPQLSQFEDGRQRSRLRTMLVHYAPVEVVYRDGGLSDLTKQMLQNDCRGALWVPQTTKDAWSMDKVLREISAKDYFRPEGADTLKRSHYPPILRALLARGGDDEPVAGRPEHSTVLGALGSAVSHLRYVGCWLVVSGVSGCGCS